MSKLTLPSVQSTLALLKKHQVHFLRLQFTDILGHSKHVEVHESQFNKALNGELTFDGSAVEGFTRVEESDMLLIPDLRSFQIYPHFSRHPIDSTRVARLICDVHLPDGTPFEGDPRWVLKRQLEEAKQLGFQMLVGTEPEFFLFERTSDGQATTTTHDKAGYFDLAPIDKGELIRREITNKLVEMGFEIEAAHHEVSPGQHEIDFRYADALEAADRIATFKFVVKRVALEHGLLASFLPKPIEHISGSGMHCHLSLLKDGENAFYDPAQEHGLSDTARHFIAGLLEHAGAIAAITNPLVNSYKRLVAGYEAPANIAWSAGNRSALIRIPAKRGQSTRAEFRLPDPSCNPYLALAVMLAAGLDGIAKGNEPPPAIARNIFKLTVREKRHHRVRDLPQDLREAIGELEKDDVIKQALGPHVLQRYLAAKRTEWREYTSTVHAWELDRYLDLI